jgi:hypothetical protein
VGVPGSSSRSSFALTITNNGNSNHVGFIHDTSVGDSKAVSKLTTFVNSTRGLSVSLMSFILGSDKLTSALT